MGILYTGSQGVKYPINSKLLQYLVCIISQNFVVVLLLYLYIRPQKNSSKSRLQVEKHWDGQHENEVF